jgi:hypothetical protein
VAHLVAFHKKLKEISERHVLAVMAGSFVINKTKSYDIEK